MDRHEDEPGGAIDPPDTFVTAASSAVPVRDRPKQSGLAAALRRARIEQAERSDVLADLRGAEITRLEILREHLGPVFDEVPAGCDLFDPGLVAGERPRLFIDMVSFVEMGRDRRAYRFVQDSRAGRAVLSESERIEPTVRAVTDYVARRLIEREKALLTIAAPTTVFAPATPGDAGDHPTAKGAKPPRLRPTAGRVLARAFLFLVEIIGSAVVFGLIGTAVFWAWQRYVG